MRTCVLAAMVLLLPLPVCHAAADPASDPDGEPQAQVILEAGAIDSTTVVVGAAAVVVYGLGYRDPVSGKWPRLAGLAGVVKAVDEHRLLLALEEQRWPQRIDLERVQRLILLGPAAAGSSQGGGTPPGGAVDINKVARGKTPPYPQREDSHDRIGLRRLVDTLIMGDLPNPQVAPTETTELDTVHSLEGAVLQGGSQLERNDRISRKLSTSALLSTGFLYGGFKLLVHSCGGDGDDPDDLGTAFCVLEGWPLLAVSGSLIAVPMGVTVWDPYDNPGAVWLGSLTGLLGGAAFSLGLKTLFPVVLGPPIMATMMSEWSRSHPGTRGLSIGLVPNRRGGLSAVASLRF